MIRLIPVLLTLVLAGCGSTTTEAIPAKTFPEAYAEFIEYRDSKYTSARAMGREGIGYVSKIESEFEVEMRPVIRLPKNWTLDAGERSQIMDYRERIEKANSYLDEGLERNKIMLERHEIKLDKLYAELAKAAENEGRKKELPPTDYKDYPARFDRDVKECRERIAQLKKRYNEAVTKADSVRAVGLIK